LKIININKNGANMNKKIVLLPLLLSCYFTTTVYANCPLPQTISYQCHDFEGRKMCTWGPDNGWYQGSADDSPLVKAGDRLASNAFKKAIWLPYIDEKHGATRCFYRGPYGENVNLFQQTGYGDVPPPVGPLWTGSSMEPGALECTKSASDCKFEFGER
jgi:hypothetical protein